MNLSMLLKDHQLYHSEFQQDHFITRRAGGTCYGQYKQALRELFKRYRGLRELYYTKEKLIIDIEELEFKLKNEADMFENRRKTLELNKYKYDMIELDKNIQDTEREFKRFYSQAYSLKEIIGELTEEKRNELDKDMWIFKLKEMAYIDFITNGRLNENTLSFISTLDKEERLELLLFVQNHERLFSWYETKEESYSFNLLDVNVKELVTDNKYLLE